VVIDIKPGTNLTLRKLPIQLTGQKIMSYNLHKKAPPRVRRRLSFTGVKGVEPSESRFGDDRLNRWAPPLQGLKLLALHICKTSGEGGIRTHGGY
jgi:hypothetical protein